MTNPAEDRFNSIQRPEDNVTEGENELNYLQKVGDAAYLLFRGGFISQEEYSLIKVKIKDQKPIIEQMRDNEEA